MTQTVTGTGIPAPAGTRTLAIEHGDYRAELSTLGAGLKSLTYQGKPLVEGYPDGEIPPLTTGLVLAPWPNRTADGRFGFDGATHQLEITEPERNNAIHGLVLGKVWEVTGHEPGQVELHITIEPAPGWPWPIELSATYRLTDEGLVATFDAETAEARPVPFAFGWHTYLQAQGAHVDSCRLTMAVDKHLPLEPRRNLPQGEATCDETTAALQEGIAMAGRVFDDCFGSAGASRTLLVDAYGNGTEMTCSDNLRWFQVFTPDDTIDVPFPGKERGRALAVEPMSAPPNALASGTDIVDLHGNPQRYEVRIAAVSAQTS